MPDTVLTLGNSREALTVIRSLGRAGYRVIAGRVEDPDPTEFCAWTSASWRHPPLEGDASSFFEALAALRASLEIDWVLPIGETPIRAFAEDPSRFPRERLAMVDGAIALECLDKSRMYGLASDLGIPVPITAGPVGHDELIAAARRCGYPCILKTNDSTERVAGEKALILADEMALREFIARASGDQRVIVQSFAPGRRVNCEFAAWEGEILLYFEHIVLRTDRSNDTGYLVDTVSCRPTPELYEHTAALARQLRSSGVGTAQFLVDPSTGSIAFLELNPRLDAACALSYHCGCDFPLLALEIARRRAGARRDWPPLAHEYRAGVRGNWLFGDLRGMRREQRAPSATSPPAWRWLGRALRSFLAADCHTIWSRQDPFPALNMYLGLKRRRAPPVVPSRGSG